MSANNHRLSMCCMFMIAAGACWLFHERPTALALMILALRETLLIERTNK